jgi:hypothetical protein
MNIGKNAHEMTISIEFTLKKHASGNISKSDSEGAL